MIVDDPPTTQARATAANPEEQSTPGSQQTSEQLVRLELTNAQVADVIRAGTQAQGPSLSLLLSGLIAEQAISEGSLEDRYAAELESGRLSHSLFRGLLILALFISSREGRGVVEVARQLGLSPSTTHRYMTTLVAFGLLVQDPGTRKYRLTQ
jgi:IclR helix-turn-helix domain